VALAASNVASSTGSTRRYTSSNLRRALLSLERMRYVFLQEGPNLDQSYVSLPAPVELLSDEVISQLLAQIRDRS
jgi:hypothetical protein